MNTKHGKIAVEILGDVIHQNKPVDMDSWVNECGTAACAWGHIAIDQRGQATGLTVEICELALVLVPTFQGLIGYSAAAQWLDIHRNDARRIFSPAEYGGPGPDSITEVIARIEQLMPNVNPTLEVGPLLLASRRGLQQNSNRIENNA